MRWLSHAIYYFYYYFCISLLWSLYCLFITLHKAMIVQWHILLLPLFLYVFTLVIVLSFYNPSQSDDCPMTYITSTTISACLYFGHYIVFLYPFTMRWMSHDIYYFYHYFCMSLAIVLSFYNPSQCDECPMTYITSTTISVCLYFGHCIVFL
jgi:hypothetical protein